MTDNICLIIFQDICLFPILLDTNVSNILSPNEKLMSLPNCNLTADSEVFPDIL
jgi:hypothetical protein